MHSIFKQSGKITDIFYLQISILSFFLSHIAIFILFIMLAFYQTGEAAVNLSMRNLKTMRNNKPSDEHHTLKSFNDLTTAQLRLPGAANPSGPSQARKAGPVQAEDSRQV